MAGHYARIYRAIWDDDDFLALSPEARLLYIAIFSHKKVNACGVVDHRPTRWTASTGLGPDEIDDSLQELERHRFITIDHDTAEIAVRTYVRHDISAGQPNMGVAVWNAWATIESRRIRRWLLNELPAELWDAAHRGGKAKGQSAVPPAALALRNEPINDRSNDEHEGCRTPFEPPSQRPSERPFEPPSEPPTPTPTTTTYAQQPAAVPTAVPHHEPVPPGPAAAAGRPADGKDARAAVLTAAGAEVAHRRDTHQRAQTARNPEGWYRSALAGIERELLEHQAHHLIHAGATATDLADLIAPTDGPLAPVTPLRQGPAPVQPRHECGTCFGSHWIDVETDDDTPAKATRCPDCNPDPLDAPTPA